MCLQINCSEEIAKLENLGALLAKAIHEKLDLNFVKPSSLLNIKAYWRRKDD